MEDVFEKYYDDNNLAENSQYSGMTKKQLVIEVEYLHDSLSSILKYIDEGGTDLGKFMLKPLMEFTKVEFKKTKKARELKGQLVPSLKGSSTFLIGSDYYIRY